MDSGVCQPGDTVMVMPAREQATVKALYSEPDANKLTYAIAGDTVRVALTGLADESMISAGTVLCAVDSPIVVARRFEA